MGRDSTQEGAMRLRSQFLLALLGAGFSWMVAGCGDSQAAPPDPPSLSRVSVSVSPKSVVNMPTGGTQTFTATVTGSTNQAVIWSIQEGVSLTSWSVYLVARKLASTDEEMKLPAGRPCRAQRVCSKC